MGNAKWHTYISNYDNLLVIEGKDLTSGTYKLQTGIIGKDAVKKGDNDIIIKKMTSWNAEASLDNFKINRVNSYASGWIDIPLGQDSVEGNGITIQAEAEGVAKEKMIPLMSDIKKFKMKFTDTQAPTNYDGFVGLNNVDEDAVPIYVAYKYKTGTETKHTFWFFTCDWKKNECTQKTKKGEVDPKYRFSPYGYSNGKSAVIFFRQTTSEDGLKGFKYNFDQTGDTLSSSTSFSQLSNGHISNIQMTHDLIKLAYTRKYPAESRYRRFKISKTDLSLSDSSFPTRSNF